MPGRKLKHDLTGQRFSHLTVVRYHGMREGIMGRNYWECVCDCGETTLVDSHSLRVGRIHSCGCKRRKYNIGDKIGEFVLLSRSENGVTFEAECSCGSVSHIQPHQLLKRKHTPMCRACSSKKYKRKDIRLQKFGKLTAVICVGTDRHRNAIWLFKCDCGNEVHRRINDVQLPRVRGQHSCGECDQLYHSSEPRSHEHLIAKE